MADFKFEIVSHLAVLDETGNGWTKELNLVSWNEREPKFDIRVWDEDHEKMRKGITFTKEEIVKLRGFVNSSDDFLDQPKVINGASELLVKIFGEQGRHARAALGTSVLPDDIPVELEMIVKIKN